MARLTDEQEIVRLQAGMRDVGLLGWVFGHRRELIVTSHRVIQFSRKTRDYALEILPRARVDYFLGGSTLNASVLIGGAAMLLVGIAMMTVSLPREARMMIGSGQLLIGGIVAAVGIVQLLFARTRMFRFGAAGGAIDFKIFKATPQQTETVIDYVSRRLH